jgi:hypothetical protein
MPLGKGMTPGQIMAIVVGQIMLPGCYVGGYVASINHVCIQSFNNSITDGINTCYSLMRQRHYRWWWYSSEFLIQQNNLCFYINYGIDIVVVVVVVLLVVAELRNGAEPP